MKRKPVIFGIKGINLTNKEKELLKKYKPWGIILFARNIKNLNQTKKLTNDIRKKSEPLNQLIIFTNLSLKINGIKLLFIYNNICL